MQYHFCDKVQ
uniref:Uncharacterized protein n=1 Tax=Arundo donax TaxID=35708 RepID=A0A0A9BIV8_ARUDO